MSRLPRNQSAGGPVMLLAPGCSWLDREVRFAFDDLGLVQACEDPWLISGELPAARGRARMSAVDLAASAGVRRQTVTEVEMGRCWPDAATLARLCRALGMQLRVR